MQAEELYPELANYIFQYESRFITKLEHAAIKCFKFRDGSNKERVTQILRFEGLLAEEATIRVMLEDDYQVFTYKIAERIYREHKYELNLNLCPECDKIARTPWAQQCRWCFVRFKTLPRGNKL